MSSSISNDVSSWDVSNMMFARVLDFACEVGGTLAATSVEAEWVNGLRAKIAGLETYSPDLTVAELCPDPSQIEFWSHVLRELGERIYGRQIGNQADQSWQVSTIWAAIDLARVLEVSVRLAGRAEGQP
jgi:hypothetical protein